MHHISTGILILATGLLFWLGKIGYHGVSFSRDWPLLLILFGLMTMIHGIIISIRRRKL